VELSQTEENYLKAIWSLGLVTKAEGVSTSELSAQLNNSAASVTEMLKRLAEKKLIHYEKYKGVQLSSKGQKIAIGIVRKHRLWEVFLLEKLKFSWDQVHDIAEQLEHIKSEELIERLDTYLGSPRHDPHGDPIPDIKGHFKQSHSHSLSQCQHKCCYVFTGVSEHSAVFLQYLTSIGLKIGDEIRIQEINDFDRSVKVRINKKQEQFLSEKVSIHILVEESR
jgi:DtxR family Mn-dependent transcriptional regulator